MVKRGASPKNHLDQMLMTQRSEGRHEPKMERSVAEPQANKVVQVKAEFDEVDGIIIEAFADSTGWENSSFGSQPRELWDTYQAAIEMPFGEYQGTGKAVVKGHVVKIPDWPGYFYIVVSKMPGDRVKLDAIEVVPASTHRPFLPPHVPCPCHLPPHAKHGGALSSRSHWRTAGPNWTSMRQSQQRKLSGWQKTKQPTRTRIIGAVHQGSPPRKKMRAEMEGVHRRKAVARPLNRACARGPRTTHTHTHTHESAPCQLHEGPLRAIRDAPMN